MVNSAGEKILDKIPSELKELAQGGEWAKLICTYYWGKEIDTGKGTPKGGVYLDFSNLPKTKYLKAALKARVMLRILYRKKWRYQGEDMSDLNRMAMKGIPWEVGLSNQYSLGGIVVDAQMSTGVPGLFAAGEVTSGVFGANRVARALTEMLVQGYQAGLAAAKYSHQVDGIEIETDQLAAVKEGILQPFRRKNGSSPSKILAAIEASADAGFGFVRDKAGLKSTLKRIETIRREDLVHMSIGSQSRAYNYEWIQAIQVENLITCIEAGVRAALMRKESRGYHLRTDCPEVDHNNWLERIVVKNDNGKMSLTSRKPLSTILPFPRGKHKNVMTYVIEYEREKVDPTSSENRQIKEGL